MTEKDLRRTYNPNYLSIDYILACQTLISCRTEANLPKFGFLVPECQSRDLPVGVNFQLPLWAARVMSKPLRTYVSVELPPGFNEAYMEVAVEEKQASANLRKIHEQFFEVGHLCTSLYHRNAGDLAEMTPEILLHRILGIGGAILLNPPSKWASAIWDKEVPPPEFMDILEFQIFQGTDNCAKNLTKWMTPLQSVKSSSF